MNRFHVLNAAGIEVASSSCFVRALRLMNTHDTADRVVRDDGVLLAERVWISASTVAAWLMSFRRWS